MPKGKYIRTPEHNKRISAALKGHPIYGSRQRSENISKAMKGKPSPKRGVPRTEATKLKISQSLGNMSEEKRRLWVERARQSHLGKTQSPEHIAKKIESRRGYAHSEATIEKIRRANSGENSSLWRGGITPLNKLMRETSEYKEWRKSVFERDNYTCQMCFARGGELNADHIKSFSKYPDFRLSLDNGRTLCVDCHRKTDNYGYKATLEMVRC